GRGQNNTRPVKHVYTDGSCTNNGKINSQCGSGVWYGHDHPENLALCIGGEANTNNIGELAAVIATLTQQDGLTPLLIHTDSEHVKKGLTERLKTWEDQGWIGVANAEYFQAAAYRMRIRSATVTFNWVKGHAGIEGNEGAD
ncbi:ribonuclease H-like protein, partial [Auriscalpium vulgare]